LLIVHLLVDITDLLHPTTPVGVLQVQDLFQ